MMEPGLSKNSMELRRHLLRFNGEDIVGRMKESGLQSPVGLIVEMTDPMGKVLTYTAMESNLSKLLPPGGVFVVVVAGGGNSHAQIAME